MRVILSPLDIQTASLMAQRPLHMPQPSPDDATYLLTIIAKIREVTGVGDKPMLSKLPEAIAAVMEDQCIEARADERENAYFDRND